MEMIQDIRYILGKRNNAGIVFQDTQMILCVFSKNNYKLKNYGNVLTVIVFSLLSTFHLWYSLC